MIDDAGDDDTQDAVGADAAEDEDEGEGDEDADAYGEVEDDGDDALFVALLLMIIRRQVKQPLKASTAQKQWPGPTFIGVRG